MFLNLSFLGVNSFFLTPQPLLPTQTTYNKITIYSGNSGCTISKLWGRNTTISDSVINNYNISNYLPSFTPETYVLGLFANNLSVGNITNITNTIISWLIYRLDPNSSQLKFIKEVDVSVTSYEDFTTLLNNQYQYYLFAKSSDEISSPINTNSVVSNYFGHYFIDVDNSISYNFDTNVESGGMNIETDVTFYNTNNEFQTVSKGNLNCAGGNISAIMWDNNSSNCTYEQGNALIAQFREFVYSSRKKLYKNRRGEIFEVELYNLNFPQLNDNIKEQIYICTFSWKEIGNDY